MTNPEDEWSGSDWLTLRLGPVWVLSALVGRTRFDPDEQNAFWDCVADAGLSAQGLGRRILYAMAADRAWLFDEFELDSRPIVSGLNAVVGLLDRAAPAEADGARAVVLGIGRAFALARGPFGRRVTVADEQTLLLVEQLLQPISATVHDNPMNSVLPI